MVEVFKTNVQEIAEAQEIVTLLTLHFPESKINFDLHDCDKILRVEAGDVHVSRVMDLVQQNGFLCNVLD
ncbi:MAG: hypothetical protein KF862_00055 [Chitinophagaceae bacterium]|nr:hypothetical protein [Chitinophagaceae bacterium]